MFDKQYMDNFAAQIAAQVVAQLGAQNGPQRRLLTVEQAAEYIGRSKQATYHLIAQAKIPTKRQGSRVFIDRLALDKWIDNLDE